MCKAGGGLNGGSVIGPNPTFDTNMRQNGISLPRSIVTKGGTRGEGIYYNFQAARTFNDVSAPMLLIYYLQGQSQDCGLAM